MSTDKSWNQLNYPMNHIYVGRCVPFCGDEVRCFGEYFASEEGCQAWRILNEIEDGKVTTSNSLSPIYVLRHVKKHVAGHQGYLVLHGYREEPDMSWVHAFDALQRQSLLERRTMAPFHSLLKLARQEKGQQEALKTSN